MADNPNQNQIDKLKKQFAKNKGTNGDGKKPGTPKKRWQQIQFLLGLHHRLCTFHRYANLHRDEF